MGGERGLELVEGEIGVSGKIRGLELVEGEFKEGYEGNKGSSSSEGKIRD